MKVIEFKKNKKIPLADKDSKLYEKQNVCHICRKKSKDKDPDDKKFCKVEDCCLYTSKYWGAIHNICNSRYNIPEEIWEVLIMDETLIVILSNSN